ncbi:hypothetical protein HLB23_09240 [Nocardia uniformis]|uniref:Secreted protein n=1 Tax=Nocardia uniformis TaxID=53432 RepID=A0A849BV25_9NOCA|nr:hypothetical protein [Nocardia uniformis]NNH70044.1 hypothetical protein [Nocardia uniformis]
MRYRKLLACGAITASTLVAAVSVGSSTAAAEPVADFAVVHTLGDTCYGQLRSGVSVVGPGVASFGMSFVKWTPTFGSPCGVGVSVHWHNLDSGAAGVVSGSIVDATTWNQTPPTAFLEVPTGPGRVSFTVTTDRPHLPVPAAALAIP